MQIKNYIAEQEDSDMAESKKMILEKSGSIRIRDNVHGDILIPEKFAPIINAFAFQRLRRIKQLATAQYAFPGADHTRFIHSLGTFHVMQQIIAHFESYFKELGLYKYIDHNEEELLLVASLLHDLGHTPFSHALEDVMPNAKKVPHEQWTIDIIMDEKDGLFHIIENTFGTGSAKKVSEFILMHNTSDPFFSSDSINLRNIFHSLISSQLDADRLDYLRRDSVSTGFSYGLVDIDRLIGGFRIGILENGNAVVCVAEKNLSDVEGYLYARYQMYRNVYLKPYKMLTEELLRKIIQHVYYLFEHDKLKITELPPGFKAALQQPYMSVEDFLSLDDYVVMGAVRQWAELKDKRAEVLSSLCQCLLYRTGYIRYKFVDLCPKTVSFFKEDLVSLIKKYMTDRAINENKDKELDDWINMFPFIVFRIAYPQLYTNNENNIYILENSGRLVEISECSKLVHAFYIENDAVNQEPTSAVSAIYYNPDILEVYLLQGDFSINDKNDRKIKEIQEEVKKLLDRNQARNCIEIEKKYHVINNNDWKEVLEQIPAFFEEKGYFCREKSNNSCDSVPKSEVQTDYYLDTSDSALLNKKCTLRIRIKNGKAEITCKKPVTVSHSNGSQGQIERYEYAYTLDHVDGSKIGEIYYSDECKKFIQKYLQDEVLFEDLKYTIIVRNERIKYLFRKNTEAVKEFQTEEKYELVFDAVTYTNCYNKKTHEEYQIELELKSDPITRLNMQALTNELEKKYSRWNLEIMTDSKYERARRFTE